MLSVLHLTEVIASFYVVPLERKRYCNIVTFLIHLHVHCGLKSEAFRFCIWPTIVLIFDPSAVRWSADQAAIIDWCLLWLFCHTWPVTAFFFRSISFFPFTYVNRAIWSIWRYCATCPHFAGSNLWAAFVKNLQGRLRLLPVWPNWVISFGP